MSSEEFRQALLNCAGRAGVVVADAELEQFERYFRLLIQWNRRVNLTALDIDPPTDQALDRLICEPLLAVQHLRSTPAHWIDLGSGGGSPAVPMKIMRPASVLTMVESRGRKAAFLREVVRELNLARTSVLGERIRDVALDEHFAKSADLITIRAVRVNELLRQSISHLLHADGRIFVFGATNATNWPDFVLERDPIKLVSNSALLILKRSH